VARKSVDFILPPVIKVRTKEAAGDNCESEATSRIECQPLLPPRRDGGNRLLPGHLLRSTQ
jgi:hypothetical protein